MSSQTMTSLRPVNVIRQLPWRLDSKAALGSILLITTFSLVGWLYLTQASAVTTTSYQIDEMRLSLEHLRNQNAVLILEIAELEALARVEGRATELGFAPTQEVQYLVVNHYPLSAQADGSYHNSVLVTENSVDAYVNEVEDSSWWQKKLDVFAAWLEGQD